MKVYGVLLSGGVGTRLGLPIPKQFAKLGNCTLLEHTLSKFATSPDIEHNIVVVSETWKRQSEEIIEKMNLSNVSVCIGGNTRQDSLYNGLMWLNQNFNLDKSDIAVSHDIARPFVTHRMIAENITKCIQFGAADTVIKASDTIINSSNGSFIDSVPIREDMYLGQTPQSFLITQFINIYDRLSPEYLSNVTDAAKILLEHGVKVGLVEGDPSNIKITTMFDLDVANYLIQKDLNNDY